METDQLAKDSKNTDHENSSDPVPGNNINQETKVNNEDGKENQEEKVPEWELARQGVKLLINNKYNEAEVLFNKYPDSLVMFAGHSFALFMDALMTFEDDKLNLATSALKELEQKCSAQTGWFRSVKSRVFGGQETQQQPLAESLESQIILADSQICLAILTFLQQDISGYLKSGWVLRKAWKIYESVYNDIAHLYKDTFGDVDVPGSTNQRHSLKSVESLTKNVGGAASGSGNQHDLLFWQDPTAMLSSSSAAVRPAEEAQAPESGSTQQRPSSSSPEPPVCPPLVVPKNSLTDATAAKTADDINMPAKPNNDGYCYDQQIQQIPIISTKPKIPCSQSFSAFNNSRDIEIVTDLSEGDSARNSILDCSGQSSPNSMRNDFQISAITSNNNSSVSNSGRFSMKKSFSVNSSLFSSANKNRKNSQGRKNRGSNGIMSRSSSSGGSWTSRLSPFPSSLSLSYFGSTFQIFSSSTSRNRLKKEIVDKPTVERLMGAVSFGYGAFQLGVSLLPPSLVRLTNLLGFGGNRKNGLDCLMYARLGSDMRAPLAMLALLWYHTIVRPFYCIDGTNVQAGADAASVLLKESEKEFGESALFLFFKGRVYRLNSNIPAALQSFQLSTENAAQREMKILSLHEVGWCHLIQLDYCEAESTFTYLKTWSRFSRGFYSYIAGICTGAYQPITNIVFFNDLKASIRKGCKVNQLEEFLTLRLKCCPDREEDMRKYKLAYWRLLVYEMLYLWNTMPSCSCDNLKKIIADCGTFQEGTPEPMMGLSKLIHGCCCSIEKRYEEAVKLLRLCLEVRKDLPCNADDSHVSAFAQYELGSILIRHEATKEEGKMALQAVNTYKGYNFESRLNVRVHGMLKHL